MSRGFLIFGIGATMLLTALLPRSVPANAQQNTGPRAGSKGYNLDEFWPISRTSPRTWKITARADRGSARPQTILWVQNEPTGPGRFVLWFSHKQGQAPGKRDGERFRLCQLPGTGWLFMDGYIDSFPDKPMLQHPVESDRILYTPAGHQPIDLIRNGVYGACGSSGQPYLVASNAPQQYRIQVWGHLTENPQRYKWYWDATVTGPGRIVDDCLQPVQVRRAIRVQEALWSFRDGAGHWETSAGDIDPQTNMPTGTGVRYGRTVWHGAGQLPYFMGGPPGPAPVPYSCVSEIGP